MTISDSKPWSGKECYSSSIIGTTNRTEAERTENPVIEANNLLIWIHVPHQSPQHPEHFSTCVIFCPPPILSHITPWYTALFQLSFLFSTLELKKHHQRHLLLFETIPLLLQNLVIQESIHSFQRSDGKWLHLSKVLVLVEKDFGMDSVYFYWANFTMLSNLLCAYYRSLWTVV